MSTYVRDYAVVQATEQDGGSPNGTKPLPVSAQIVLQPIAAPSVLGLFGFAGATLVVAAHQAGWYGGATAANYLFPFAAFFGGLAQFMAAKQTPAVSAVSANRAYGAVSRHEVAGDLRKRIAHPRRPHDEI